MPRSCSRSSTLRSESGYFTYIITTRRITSGDELKCRNGSAGLVMAAPASGPRLAGGEFYSDKAASGPRSTESRRTGRDVAGGVEGAEVGVVGALGVGADPLVQLVGVLAHKHTPAPGLDRVQDDLRSLGRGHRRAVVEVLRLSLDPGADVVVADGAVVDA